MSTQREELIVRAGFDGRALASGMRSSITVVKDFAKAATSAMDKFGHSTARTKLHLAEMVKQLTSGNIEGAVMSFSRLSAHLGTIGRFVFGLGGAAVGVALLGYSKAKDHLAEINAELDHEGELAAHSIGNMKKSWGEAMLEGAKSAFKLENHIRELADAQQTLKEKTDAAIKSLHAQQALEQEAISAKSGADIAKVNRLEEMGLISPEQGILSRADIKSKAAAAIEASKKAAQQAELSKLTLAYLGSDASSTDMQKAMANANAAAFSSPSAIARNAMLKDIPRQRADVEKDLEERKKQLASATAKLEGNDNYQRGQRLQDWLDTPGEKNAFQENGAREQIHEIARLTQPLRDSQAMAQRFVGMDTSLLGVLDARKDRLGTRQDQLADKAAEAVTAYTAHIAQVKELSRQLDDLTNDIRVQNKFAPGIEASKASQDSYETAGALVKTKMGLALVGAQRIASDLFAGRKVSPDDVSALTGIESIIAGRKVNLRTAASMAEVGAHNPAAFQNQIRNLLDAATGININTPAGAASLAALDKKLNDLAQRGSPANPVYVKIPSE